MIVLCCVCVVVYFVGIGSYLMMVEFICMVVGFGYVRVIGER